MSTENSKDVVVKIGDETTEVKTIVGEKEADSGSQKENEGKEVIEVVEEIITYDMLDKVSYGKDLQAKFEELGVGDCYKPGKKKKVLITNALARLAEIKRLKEQGVSEDEIKPKAIESESLKKHLEKEAFVKEQLDKIDSENEDAKAFVEKDFSEEVMREKIERVDANLAGGNKNFKDSLNRRRRVLIKAYKMQFKKDYVAKEV